MKNNIISDILLTNLISFAAFAQGDPKTTEVWEPVPKVITPVIGNKAPSDATVLFDG